MAVNFDFLILEQDLNQLPIAISSVFNRAEICSIQTYPIYKSNFKETGFYYDPGHPGRLGHRILGNYLLSILMDELVVSEDAIGNETIPSVRARTMN